MGAFAPFYAHNRPGSKSAIPTRASAWGIPTFRSWRIIYNNRCQTNCPCCALLQFCRLFAYAPCPIYAHNRPGSKSAIPTRASAWGIPTFRSWRIIYNNRCQTNCSVLRTFAILPLIRISWPLPHFAHNRPGSKSAIPTRASAWGYRLFALGV